MTTNGSDFLFVIDTEQYAGNFEREMCAYLTGSIGDCGVGEEMVELFLNEIPQKNLFDNVVSVPDEHGCNRPATIWPTPGWANDGMGNEYKVKGAKQKELCAAYVKSEEEYFLPLIKQKQAIIKDLQAGKTIANWTVEAAEREIKQHQKRIDEAKKLKKVSAFPAYLSVGIWFDTRPTDKQIKLMKERANKFAEAKRNYGRLKDWEYTKNFKVTITGFRLVTFKKKKLSEAV